MTRSKPTLLKLALAVCLSAFLLGCAGPKITPKNYVKILNGMTMEDVKDILGEPTRSQTTGVGDSLSTEARWKNSSSGATLKLNFLNNKVKSKIFNQK